MASRLIEADEEFIAELYKKHKWEQKHKKKYGLLDQHFPTMGKDERKKWPTWKLRSTDNFMW